MDRILDDVLDLRERDPSYKYNLETTWWAVDYLGHRSPAVVSRFLEAVRHGDIGLNALYANLGTEGLSTEAMARALYPCAELQRQYGIPTDAAAQGDQPTYVGALPTFLAAAGVRFLAGGANQERAPLYRNAALAGKEPLNLRSPYFWEGPDGGRVLTWMCEAYAQIARLMWGYPRHDHEYAGLPRERSSSVPKIMRVSGTKIVGRRTIEPCQGEPGGGKS